MPAEGKPQFPNPDLAPRLVLYPIAGGGVALDWSLDPVMIQQARIAFATHGPVAKLYLRRAGADGSRLAEALLDDLSDNPSGDARFEAPLVGAVQAELGLEGQRDGGWLLLARSNRLEVVPEPRRLEAWRLPPASIGRAPASPVDMAATRALTMSVPLKPTPGELMPSQLAGPAALDPQVPIRDQIAARHPSISAAYDLDTRAAAASDTASAALIGSAGRLAKQPPDPRPSKEPEARSLADAAPAIDARGDAPLTTRFPDPSLASLSRRPELRGSPIPLVVVGDHPGDHLNTSGPRAPTPGIETAPGHRAAAASEHVPLDQEPPNRQDSAPAVPRTSRGSGPLSPYPSGEGAVIQGELHVFGSAAPGRLLGLGGHLFRVGPGGRFSFRVALDDPDLLAALLARLPRLPVEERES